MQQLEILRAVVDSIASAAAPLGVASTIAPLQERVPLRMIECTADAAEATTSECTLDNKTHAVGEVISNAVSLRNFSAEALRAGSVVVHD